MSSICKTSIAALMHVTKRGRLMASGEHGTWALAVRRKPEGRGSAPRRTAHGGRQRPRATCGNAGAEHAGCAETGDESALPSANCAGVRRTDWGAAGRGAAAASGPAASAQKREVSGLSPRPSARHTLLLSAKPQVGDSASRLPRRNAREERSSLGKLRSDAATAPSPPESAARRRAHPPQHHAAASPGAAGPSAFVLKSSANS